MIERRLHLPPALVPDDYEVHDAELARLRIEDFGRRVRVSLVTCVDGGNYHQPAEVVLEDFDHAIWVDDTEDDEVLDVSFGGPVGRRDGYGTVEGPEHGVDYTLRCGGMNLTVIRARRIVTTAVPGFPPSEGSSGPADGWSPLEVKYIHEHMPDRRYPDGSICIESLELEPVDQHVALRFAVENQDRRSWTARAKYAGIATFELEPRLAYDGKTGEVRSASQRPHGDAIRLRLGATGARISIVGRQWAHG